MVGPFLEVTLVPESDLRKATLNIFFDMMQTEEKIRGNFKQVRDGVILNFIAYSNFLKILTRFLQKLEKFSSKMFIEFKVKFD